MRRKAVLVASLTACLVLAPAIAQAGVGREGR